MEMDLQQFRDEWKEELRNQETKVTKEQQISLRSISQSDEINSAVEQPVTCSCIMSASEPSTICLCPKDCNTSVNIEITESCNHCIPTTKRKCQTKGSCKSKKTKKSKFDEIFTEKEKGAHPQERLLDRLIQDIDEITAIPFFDISIPKEVAVNIFQFLGIRDLCSCAQVSKSWRVLSEDELIWCRICHRLGRETIYTTREKKNWKEIVKHNIERQRLLVSNWKARTGKLTQLEHTRGKILCSVDSYKTTVVAGYTNGDVKFWDISTGDSCIFRPSNTSLSIAEDYEIGTEQNFVQTVVTSHDITAALYSQGNVDIWSLKTGSDAFQAYSPSTRQFPVTSLCLSRNSNTIVTKYGPFLDVLFRDSSEDFQLYTHLDSGKEVRSVRLLETERAFPSILFSQEFTVNIFCSNDTQDLKAQSKGIIDQSARISEIHNITGCPVSMFDVKASPALLAVAVGSYMHDTAGDWLRVHIYDIQSGKLLQSLQSHSPGEGSATMASCLNLANSPPNEIVTASTDRQLRLYDLRQPYPTQVLGVHPHKVTCVQMDEWKVISGGDDGFIYGSVYFWDRRMGKQLWHLSNRHPVQYCTFQDKHLIIGNIPSDKFPQNEDFEVASHSKYRGSVQVYDFLEDLTTQDVPEICLSTYDQPGASKYNISLAVPYDALSY